MLAYFIRRTLQFIPTIIGVTMIIFLLLNVLPGNAALMAGDSRREMDEQAIEELNVDMTRRLIDQICQQNKPLADALAELVEDFRFDILQKLFENIEE